MRNNKKVLGAVVLASVLAATGTAFTNSNTGAGTDDQVGGYNDASVTGVVVNSVVYAYSTDRATLQTVTYTLDASTPVALTGVDAEVSTDGGTTWVLCPTGAPRTAPADPIVCTLNLATTAVTSMNFVVRDADSTPAV